jgi:Spy/CpxP family protein refolding chaperone
MSPHAHTSRNSALTAIKAGAVAFAMVAVACTGTALAAGSTGAPHTDATTTATLSATPAPTHNGDGPGTLGAALRDLLKQQRADLDALRAKQLTERKALRDTQRAQEMTLLASCAMDANNDSPSVGADRHALHGNRNHGEGDHANATCRDALHAMLRAHRSAMRNLERQQHDAVHALVRADLLALRALIQAWIAAHPRPSGSPTAASATPSTTTSVSPSPSTSPTPSASPTLIITS